MGMDIVATTMLIRTINSTYVKSKIKLNAGFVGFKKYDN
jgi:hypothetical protein